MITTPNNDDLHLFSVVPFGDQELHAQKHCIFPPLADGCLNVFSISLV